MQELRPSFPFTIGLISLSFLLLAGMFAFSPYRSYAMTIASIIFGAAGLSILWLIDYCCLSIRFHDQFLKVHGFFQVRNLTVPISHIEGYEIHQKVDQINGLHGEVQLVIKNKRNLILPRIAYGDYSNVLNLCESRFKFLGFKELKYGRLLGRLIPIMFLISGIMAALVGLLKLLK